MTVELEKPRPRPTPVTAPFWDALRAERIVVQRCAACGGWVHYPRSRCSHCLSDALAWHEVSGGGTLYTFSVARQPTAPPFADEVPQIIAVVELDEGPRLTTTLVGADPDAIRVGQRVVPVFDHGDDDVTLLRYRTAEV
jgi:uncharacterized protein